MIHRQTLQNFVGLCKDFSIVQSKKIKCTKFILNLSTNNEFISYYNYNYSIQNKSKDTYDQITLLNLFIYLNLTDHLRYSTVFDIYTNNNIQKYTEYMDTI